MLGVLRQAELGGEARHESAGIFSAVMLWLALIGQQRGMVPNRLLVFSPKHAECPARQLLARIPFALPQMQQAARRIALEEFVHDLGGVSALGWPLRIGVPLACIAIRGGHKGGLATHGQAHIARHQILIHPLAQRHNLRPLRIGVGFGHARCLQHPRDAHLVFEHHISRAHQAFNWRSA